ncbi:unnamed protein product, partial [Closterium sp. NIES-54]
FGVVLLEVLSGRPPVVEGICTLVHWAQGAMKKRQWQDLVDPFFLDSLSQTTCSPPPPAVAASAPAADPVATATSSATATPPPPAAAVAAAAPLAAHRVPSFLSVLRLAAACVDANPVTRPPFEALAHTLHKILK